MLPSTGAYIVILLAGSILSLFMPTPSARPNLLLIEKTSAFLQTLESVKKVHVSSVFDSTLLSAFELDCASVDFVVGVSVGVGVGVVPGISAPLETIGAKARGVSSSGETVVASGLGWPASGFY